LYKGAELAQNLLEMPEESEESAILGDQIDELEREAIGLAARVRTRPRTIGSGAVTEKGTIMTVLYVSCTIALVAAAVLDWVSTRRPDDSPWE